MIQQTVLSVDLSSSWNANWYLSVYAALLLKAGAWKCLKCRGVSESIFSELQGKDQSFLIQTHCCNFLHKQKAKFWTGYLTLDLEYLWDTERVWGNTAKKNPRPLFLTSFNAEHFPPNMEQH